MAGAGLIGIFFINIQKIWVRWDNKLQQLSRNDPFDYSGLSRSAGEATGPGAPLPFPQQKKFLCALKAPLPGHRAEFSHRTALWRGEKRGSAADLALNGVKANIPITAGVRWWQRAQCWLPGYSECPVQSPTPTPVK